MSNEQKLREALCIAVNYIDMDALYTVAGADYDTIKEALSTTEPEPTGMPELPEPDHKADRWPTSHVYTTNQTSAYGEQCWKAGYKHGAWGDKPAVNQQLTTEPFDEREAFEKWLGIKPCGAAHDFGWAAWQARAAMAQGVKG